MTPIVRNILAVIAGMFIGSIVNMGLVTVGPTIIPPPEGSDTSTYEGLKASMHLFTARHFIFPFLAHALGTFVGAFTASTIAESHKRIMAYIIGGLFLAGGVTSILTLPSPTWFNILDLLGAYIPMAWSGAELCFKINRYEN